MNDLYQILFGPDWETAAHGAEGQLREWAEAFDAWLDQIEATGGRKLRGSYRHTWQDFWKTAHRLPWQVEPADVTRWVADLQCRRRSPSTIRRRISELENFYKFRAAWEVTTASPTAFNPIKGIKRPHVEPVASMEVMSREEVHALLEAVDREESLVGRRDYALILTTLVTGKAPVQIRTLRWGDLPGFIDEAPGAAGLEATATAHRAIEEYLQLSGRLETIDPADYVFAPLSDSLTIPSGKACDWNPHRPLCEYMVTHLLKRYAYWAGLDGERVNWHALRNTAALLRLEAGETLEGLQAFLGHSQRKKTEDTIRYLAGRQNRPLWLHDVCNQRQHSKIKRWQRRPRGRPGAQPGNPDLMKHGFSARRPSLQEVLNKLDRNEIGLEWETLMLRAIMHRAIELCQEEISPKDWMQMMEGFSIAAQRLGNLLRAGNDLKKTAREMKNQPEMDALEQALNDVIHEMGLG